jgi:hypothetical protein
MQCSAVQQGVPALKSCGKQSLEAEIDRLFCFDPIGCLAAVQCTLAEKGTLVFFIFF